MSATIVLPKQLVLGDFDEAHAALLVSAGERGAGDEPPLLDGREVRRVDAAGLQWLVGCLRADTGAPAARLEGNAVIEGAMRISGADRLLDPGSA